MTKLSRKLTMNVAAAALYAVAAVGAPASIVLLGAAVQSHAKDGGSGHGGDDGGNSGSSGSGSSGSSGSGGVDGRSESSGSGDDGGRSGSSSNSGNSGQGSVSFSHDDDSDDDFDDDRDDDDNRAGASGYGHGYGERPEIHVDLTNDQIAGLQAGTLKLVDNLGRVLEVEVEVEHGKTEVSAKPHRSDARSTPGPITSVNVVPARSN